MFDTSLVRAHTVAAPRRLSLFAISVALHSAIALAAISATVASVDFPKTAPDQVEVYRPVNPPPPLGTQNPGPKTQPPRDKPPVVKQPAIITQPQEIPQETPIPEPSTEPITTDTGGDGSGDSETGTGDGLLGVPGGQPGGTGTEPGGDGIFPGTGPLKPGGEVTSARVLRRVEPQYPRAMQPLRLPTAVVIVRCVIDKQGRIRDPEVISTTHPGFNNSVLDAVRNWTFVPGTLRGEPVDTWFELKVSFQLR